MSVSLRAALAAIQAEMDEIRQAPPNEPDIQALWEALAALEARVGAIEAVTKKLKL